MPSSRPIRLGLVWLKYTFSVMTGWGSDYNATQLNWVGAELGKFLARDHVLYIVLVLNMVKNNSRNVVVAGEERNGETIIIIWFIS